MSRYKIIVVEDQQVIRFNLCRAIDWQSQHCEILAECSTGDEGLRAISTLHPDIVITDIRLPGMDGIQMLEKAKQTAEFQSIIITGFNQFEYAKRAIGLSVVDYILKPIDEEKLIAAVQKAISIIEEKRELEAYRRTPNSVYTIDKLEETTKDAYLKQVLEYIRRDYTKHLNLDTIGREIGLSGGYLSRKIKALTGLSFLDILQRHRIEVAQDLMKHDKSLKYYEIAEKVGFSSYKRFSGVFRNICGYTPSDLSKKEEQDE